jgi:hypothetical protein
MVLISQNTIKDYCKHLTDKVFNLLIQKEKNNDVIKPIDKVVEELKGSTLSDIKPFMDNQFVLEIVFKISGLKEEKNNNNFRTTVLDCCNKISQLPNKFTKEDENGRI